MENKKSSPQEMSSVGLDKKCNCDFKIGVCPLHGKAYLTFEPPKDKALPRIKSKNPKMGKTVHTDLERLKYKEI